MAPSGGPRDVIPPMIVTTWPDTFEIVEASRDPIKITFNERISERPTQGTMEQAVVVSPVTGEYKVKHSRSGLEVEVLGGLKPDLVYRVRVLPTVKDLFSNTMEGPFELVFSTGADYENNVVAGMIFDRLTGDAVGGARVEARSTELDDPPVYLATSDSLGVFALRYLPAGPYILGFYQDLNRNETPDYRELQGDWGPVPLGVDGQGVDTVLVREVMLLRPDTIPARLIGVEAQDSVTVRLAFDDFLDAEGSLDPIQVVIAEEEGDTLVVEGLLWPRELDSIRAVADSIARVEELQAQMDSLQVMADSLSQLMEAMEAASDTLGIDTIGPALARIQNRLAPPEPEELEPREGLREEEAPEPILPQQAVYVVVADSIPANRLFQVIVSGVVNINGLPGGGGDASFTWEPPAPPEEEADTLAAPVDTTSVPPDTAAVANPGAVPPDTTTVPPDTTLVPPDTTGVPPDTTAARSLFLPGRMRLLPQ